MFVNDLFISFGMSSFFKSAKAVETIMLLDKYCGKPLLIVISKYNDGTWFFEYNR